MEGLAWLADFAQRLWNEYRLLVILTVPVGVLVYKLTRHFSTAVRLGCVAATLGAIWLMAVASHALQKMPHLAGLGAQVLLLALILYVMHHLWRPVGRELYADFIDMMVDLSGNLTGPYEPPPDLPKFAELERQGQYRKIIRWAKKLKKTGQYDAAVLDAFMARAEAALAREARGPLFKVNPVNISPLPGSDKVEVWELPPESPRDTEERRN